MLARFAPGQDPRPRLRLPPRDGSRRRGRRSARRDRRTSTSIPKPTARSSRWTLVPGIIVILLILRLPDERLTRASRTAADADAAEIAGGDRLGARRTRGSCRGVSISRWPSSCLFALGNASDAFILLRLDRPRRRAGLDSAAVVRPARREDDFVGRRRRAVGSVRTTRDDRARLSVVRGDLRRVRAGSTRARGHRRVSRLRPLLRLDRRGGEGVGRRHGAGGRARHRVRHLQRARSASAVWPRACSSARSGRACRRHAAFLTGACLALAASVLLYLAFSHAKNSRHQR